MTRRRQDRALIDRLEAVIEHYFADVRQELLSGSLCVLTSEEKPAEIAIHFLPLSPFDLFDALGLKSAPEIKRSLYDALLEVRSNGESEGLVEELIAVFERWRARQDGES